MSLSNAFINPDLPFQPGQRIISAKYKTLLIGRVTYIERGSDGKVRVSVRREWRVSADRPAPKPVQYEGLRISVRYAEDCELYRAQFGSLRTLTHAYRRERGPAPRTEICLLRPQEGKVRLVAANRVLHNSAPAPIKVWGLVFPTVEHAYQASKTDDRALIERIRTAHSAPAARRIGRRIPLRPGWTDLRVEIMRELLEIKFSVLSMQKVLLATGNAPLIKLPVGRGRHDHFWSQCDRPCCLGAGQNKGGQLLQELRERLRQELSVGLSSTGSQRLAAKVRREAREQPNTAAF